MSKQQKALDCVNHTIKTWDGTFEMASEYPKLKKNLKYIKKLLKEEKFKLAENHLYYTMTAMYDKPLGIPVKLAHDLERIEKTIKEIGIEIVHEASLSIACLGADWTEHFEDESVTKNHKKWVLKDQEGLQQDLDHIQDQITILENFFDPDCTYNPYTPSKTNV
jgi:hypothetical protein